MANHEVRQKVSRQKIGWGWDTLMVVLESYQATVRDTRTRPEGFKA